MLSAQPAPRAALWDAVIRFESGKVRPWMGIRNTLGIVLPVVIGAVMGDTAGGMIAGIGALNVAVADGTDPYGHRARRLIIACLFCALAVVAGGLAGGTHAISAILAAFAFAAGMMVALGPAASDIGLMTLVTLIVFSAQPLHRHQAFSSGMLALGGGLLQTALALALWPLRRKLPECRALSALYLELARAASAASPATQAPPASGAITEAQQALATLGAGDSIEGQRYLALLSQAERIRLALLTLARLRVRLSRETGTEEVIRILDRCAALTSQVLQHVGESLCRGEAQPQTEPVQELAQLVEELRQACRSCSPAVTAMLEDTRSQVDALAGQLRAVLELSSHTTAQGLAEFERREAAHPWKLRFAGTLSTLTANLRLETATFRHAVRLAVCVSMGEILARDLHWRRPYWVPMTVALVLKPDFTTTVSRGLQRLLGTLIGLIAATVLFHLLNPPLGLQIALIALFAFLMRAYGPANYGILAIAVTGLVVLLFAVAGISPSNVIIPRGLNTLAGGLIALLAYRLWPTWERTHVPEALARMLDSYRAYFQAIRNAYLQQEDSTGAALDRARLAARIARSELEASIARMRAEPGSPADRIATFDRILADSHRFIHAVMSLEACLLTSQPVPARDAFRAFSNHVDITLYYLSSGLRGTPIAPADFPDLREDHHALIESGDSRVQRHALVNTEADRIVNSLNTITGEMLPLVKSREGGERDPVYTAS